MRERRRITSDAAAYRLAVKVVVAGFGPPASVVARAVVVATTSVQQVVAGATRQPSSITR